MWMKRQVRKPAWGAKNAVATRPSQVFTRGALDSEWWLASWATVNRR